MDKCRCLDSYQSRPVRHFLSVNFLLGIRLKPTERVRSTQRANTSHVLVSAPRFGVSTRLAELKTKFATLFHRILRALDDAVTSQNLGGHHEHLPSRFLMNRISSQAYAKMFSFSSPLFTTLLVVLFHA